MEGVDLFNADKILQNLTSSIQSEYANECLTAYGKLAGADLLDAGFNANENPPQLKTHNRFGNRIDRVKYHPAYHQLMDAGISNGLHSMSWEDHPQHSQLLRSSLLFLHNQAEAGTSCPITMTHAAVPALRHQPDIAEKWVPKICTRSYDGTDKPWQEKSGLTVGMAMTEKQGGSDVRANTTKALPLDKSGPGRVYQLNGHKWFCSAPMCDGFLVLAQTEKGISCFLLPRWKEDGTKNGFLLQRLKDKLGNRSNASSEVEFDNAHAWLLGEEGKGVRVIIDMVAQTRLDCMIGSSALMRMAVSQALHHVHYRKTFGELLIDHRLMQNVITDLALETEAAMLFFGRVAQALDNAHDKPEEKAFYRLMTAVGKFWICKRAPGMIYEAMESLGGNGYVEESILPRLYREAPVNSIWEGSGNVQCLDMLRTLSKAPDTLGIFLKEMDAVKGEHPTLDAAVDSIKTALSNQSDMEYHARAIVSRMALCQQASLMIQSAPSVVSDAFVTSRFSPEPAYVFGCLPTGVDTKAVLERSLISVP